MLPAFGVVALGVDTTEALVLSQVVLSTTLPLPMVALLLFTRRPGLMGRFANRWPTQAAAGIGAVIVLTLNALLLAETFGISPIG